MSLNYLLDGYNIIHLLPQLAQKELEASRNSLIHLLETFRPQGSVNNKVTVVFDGQFGIYGQQQSSFVKVVFSKGESADDYIKRMVSTSGAKKAIVVVTNDKDIKFFVRAEGATVMSVENFMSKIFSAGRSPYLPVRSSQKPKEDTKYISKTLEHNITSEFEQIWLKKSVQEKESAPKKRGLK